MKTNDPFEAKIYFTRDLSHNIIDNQLVFLLFRIMLSLHVVKILQEKANNSFLCYLS